MAPLTLTERRLMDLAVHPEHFDSSAPPPAHPDETPAGRALVEADRLWAHRRRAGHRVDLVALHAAEQDAEEALAEGRRRWRADVLGDTEETRTWLWRTLGVLLATDLDTGERSLSHRLWSEAVVPPGSEDDWSAWCGLRGRCAHAGILRSIRNNLDDEGRVHARIRTFGALTGRMAVSGPALQALPGALRGLLLPDPGRVLVSADIHAVEPSLAAWMSADERLAADLAEADPYAALARSVFGVDAGAEERVRAKTALLAQLYGQGTSGLARRLGITPAAAAQVVEQLRGRYARLFAWLDSLEKATNLETPWGRRLPVPPVDPTTGRRQSHLARNWTVQGSAADLFRAAVARVAARASDGAACLWLPVHDELVVSVAEDRAEGAARVLTEELSPRLGAVQLRAEAKVHPERWGK